MAHIELADLWRVERRYTDSERLGRDALAAMQKGFEPQDARLIHALVCHARLLAETNRNAEAAEILRRISVESPEPLPR